MSVKMGMEFLVRFEEAGPRNLYDGLENHEEEFLKYIIKETW